MNGITVIKIIGSGLILVGSAGFGRMFMVERFRMARLMADMVNQLEQLKSETVFGRCNLEQGCYQVGVRNEKGLAPAFLEISERMCKHDGLSFSRLWEEEVTCVTRKEHLPKGFEDRLLRLGRQCITSDPELQRLVMTRVIEELTSYVGQYEKKLENQNRVCCSLAACMGIFIVILLL